jgi:hypothetical protein
VTRTVTLWGDAVYWRSVMSVLILIRGTAQHPQKSCCRTRPLCCQQWEDSPPVADPDDRRLSGSKKRRLPRLGICAKVQLGQERRALGRQLHFLPFTESLPSSCLVSYKEKADEHAGFYSYNRSRSPVATQVGGDRADGLNYRTRVSHAHSTPFALRSAITSCSETAWLPQSLHPAPRRASINGIGNSSIFRESCRPIVIRSPHTGPLTSIGSTRTTANYPKRLITQ